MAGSARGLLPSLRLNLADVHRRLGHGAEALHHVEQGLIEVDGLPDDGYGRMIRLGLERLLAGLVEA